MPICPECRKENPELGAKCPRCADSYYVYDEAGDEQDDPYIGHKAAGKYVVVAKISEGGMGTVYRALQLPVEREVAFKVLRTELEDNTEVRNRFTREARAVSKISHPNIITLHDFGFDESDYPYMVMEYAPGESLDEWIYQNDIDLERIVHVMRQMLSALADAHDQGIVHRDLKPENIMVTGTGTDEDFIKLLDFGIARLVNEQATEHLTKEGEVFGTPHYMSPEQAEGETGIGTEADVYALGIMFYEMLCGECPFDAPKPLSILFKQINEDLPPIEGRPGVAVPGAIKNLVRKATRKDPDDRFSDAGAMLTELKKLEDPDSSALIAAPYTNGEGARDGTGTLHGTGERAMPNAADSQEAPEAREELVTGNTLGFDEAEPKDRSGQIVDRTSEHSNQVTVQDPDHDLFNRSFGADRTTLALLGLGAFVVVGGVVATLLLGGENPSTAAPEADQTVAATADDETADDDNSPAAADDSRTDATDSRAEREASTDAGTSSETGVGTDETLTANEAEPSSDKPSSNEKEAAPTERTAGSNETKTAESGGDRPGAEEPPSGAPDRPTTGGRSDESPESTASTTEESTDDEDDSTERDESASGSETPEIEKFGAPDKKSESSSESSPEPTKFGAPE